jgi:hypothetical protein
MSIPLRRSPTVPNASVGSRPTRDQTAAWSRDEVTRGAIAAFVAEFGDLRASEAVLCVLYWMERHQGSPASASAVAAYYPRHEGARIFRVSEHLRRAARMEWAEPAGTGWYRLTPGGVARVDMLRRKAGAPRSAASDAEETLFAIAANASEQSTRQHVNATKAPAARPHVTVPSGRELAMKARETQHVAPERGEPIPLMASPPIAQLLASAESVADCSAFVTQLELSTRTYALRLRAKGISVKRVVMLARAAARDALPHAMDRATIGSLLDSVAAWSLEAYTAP